ncbi:choice-of-anchor I family protein [Frigoribacterium sp. PhB116]|uniref:choice-of-anchor I family protein n=1 Tax=Frigoribacterium sp. PhB116 TaxID=2485174 RepID=UPI0010DD1B14|nr:choice-of-anchor I family protein [Frigoribacterium sp. PhB116]TDT63115.1 hypothetical protein EDF20_2416 [Frigoribacterium sp. PhB116]
MRARRPASRPTTPSSAPAAASTPSRAARVRRPLGTVALTGTAALAAAGLIGLSAPASAAVVAAPIEVFADQEAFDLQPVGSYETGTFDASAAEIVEHWTGPARDASGETLHRLLVVNAAEAVVEVLDVGTPSAPVSAGFTVQTTGVTAADGSVVPAGAVANSVSVRADGLGAVAVESDDKTDLGWVVFFDAAGDGGALGAVRVGSLPDMVAFSPDGARVIVANEGEPAEDYSVDPEGTISIVEAPATVSAPAQSAVSTADFHDFEAGGSSVLDPEVRIFGGRADAGTVTPESPLLFPVSENLEPEYATFSADGATAWVSLQEANALAIVDVASATVAEVVPLGTVDRAVVPFDPSDRDGAGGGPAIAIGTWAGVEGYLMPDTIASYEVGGSTYVVTANEGDSRDWDGYSEVSRVSALGRGGVPPVCATSPAAGSLAPAALGRLNVTTANGLSADGSCYETLYTFGSRSFSILDASGQQVFDSGSDFEEITAAAAPEFFNSNHTESALDGRSDDKGPEPEGVALGEIDGRTYAFIGFERVGGIAVYDVTVPTAASFVAYVNNRDFTAPPADASPAALSAAGDLGPEGLAFIPAADSATGEPMLAVGNEVSGTTTLFAITVPAAVEPPVVVPPVVVDPPVVAPGDGAGAPGAGAGAGAGTPGAGAPGSGNGAGGAGTSTAAGTTRDGLAYTGSELVSWALPLAGGLVALGAVLLVRARRRAARLRG